MRLEEWEVTIQAIADDCNRRQEGTREDEILKKWRVKLGKEPTLLPPFRIDAIVREARQGSAL